MTHAVTATDFGHRYTHPMPIVKQHVTKFRILEALQWLNVRTAAEVAEHLKADVQCVRTTLSLMESAGEIASDKCRPRCYFLNKETQT